MINPSSLVKESCTQHSYLCLTSFMHLNVFHHASWHVVHLVKQASFITCSAYEIEDTRVDQVLEEVHPPEVLVPSLTPLIHRGF